MADEIQINGYWLEEGSDEFQDVRDQVIISLKSITTSSMEIWKIESSSSKTFERTYADSLRLSCWYDVRRKASNGSTPEFGIQEICTQGFTSANGSGVEFFTGIIPKDLQEEYPNMNILVMTDVAVGRSFVVDTNPSTTEIPDGFDSLYLLDQPMDADNNGEFSLQEYQAAANFESRSASDYHHKFYIKDYKRANPRYVVRFIIDQNKKEYGSSNAVVSVLDEKFVNSRDLLIDSSTFVPVTSASSNSSIGGKAGSLARSSTRYLNIDDAVNKAINEFKDSRESDTIAKHKKEWINSQLDILDEKVRNLNLNYAEISEGIFDSADRATKELQASTRRKLELVLSMEIELRRQLENYDWCDANLNKHINNLHSNFGDVGDNDKSSAVQKMEFIRAWKNYSKRRNQSNNAKLTDVKILQSIQPDIKMNGDLFITNHADIGGMANAATLGSNVDAFANEPKRLYNLQSYLSSNFGRNVSAVKAVANKEFPGSVHQILLTQYDKIQESLESSINGSALTFPIHMNGGSGLGELPSGVFNSNLVQLTGPSVAIRSNEMLPDPADAFKDKIIEIVKDSLFSSESYFSDNEPDYSDAETVQSKAESRSVASQGVDNGSKIGNKQQDGAAQQLQQSASNKSKLIQRYKFDPSITFSSPWYKQSSLSDAAERKLKLFSTKKLPDPPIDNLHRSNIVNGEEAKNIMLNLPFFTLAPSFKLIYDFKSTKSDISALDDLYARSVACKGPVLLLIQSEGLKFGAYLSHPIIQSGAWSGNASSFLFSVTWNLKLPFHGRNPQRDSKGSFTFRAEKDYLEIGNGDLKLHSTLKTATSELENCFGLATSTTALSESTRYLFTGSNEIAIERLELWNVINQRQ